MDKTPVYLTQDELALMHAALGMYSRFHRTESPCPCPALADQADRIARRVAASIEPAYLETALSTCPDF